MPERIPRFRSVRCPLPFRIVWLYLELCNWILYQQVEGGPRSERVENSSEERRMITLQLPRNSFAVAPDVSTRSWRRALRACFPWEARTVRERGWTLRKISRKISLNYAQGFPDPKVYLPIIILPLHPLASAPPTPKNNFRCSRCGPRSQHFGDDFIRSFVRYLEIKKEYQFTQLRVSH